MNEEEFLDGLLREIQELREKLDKYENPEDMTLMMMWCTEKVKDENKELKTELSGYRQAILDNKEMLGLKEQNDRLKQKYENAVADYETTMFEKEQLNSLVNSCQEEIRQLKKQLEEKENIACNWKDSCLENAGKIEILETHQKEFIKYLAKRYNDTASVIGSYGSNTDMLYEKKYLINEILQKYKEIIGSDSEC